MFANEGRLIIIEIKESNTIFTQSKYIVLVQNTRKKYVPIGLKKKR